MKAFSAVFAILLLIISSLLWGYFEGQIYELSKKTSPLVAYIIPMIFLTISIILYAVGIIVKPIQLGLWIAVWEVLAYGAALVSSTNADLKQFNETIAIGWVFLTIGILLITMGWELLYSEYLNLG